MAKDTGKKAASHAAKTLKSSAGSAKSKTAAGSALTQKRDVSTQASPVLHNGRSSAATKAAAGSALSQLKNPRSGRYVLIDRAAGKIIGHKETNGAYKGVPIAGKAARGE